MAHHPVNWFQIQGPNGQELERFYRRVFQWRMTPAPGPGDMQMVARETDGIAGGVGASQNGQAGVAVYISVGDLNAYLAKVHEAGGKMSMAPMDLPEGMGRIAGFTDPAGNWIGLWQAPAGGRAAAAKRSGAKKKKATASGTKKASTKKAGAKKAVAKKKKSAARR